MDAMDGWDVLNRKLFLLIFYLHRKEDLLQSKRIVLELVTHLAYSACAWLPATDRLMVDEIGNLVAVSYRCEDEGVRYLQLLVVPL